MDPRSPIAILTFAVDAPDGCSEFLLVVSSRHFIRNRSRGSGCPPGRGFCPVCPASHGELVEGRSSSRGGRKFGGKKRGSLTSSVKTGVYGGSVEGCGREPAIAKLGRRAAARCGIVKANESREHYRLEVNAMIWSMIAREDDLTHGTRER